MDTVSLASISGSLTLPNSTENWGWMKMYNGANEAGDEILAVDYTVANNWFIGEVVTFFGNPSTVQIGPNGVPIINSDWITTDVNPVINKYQVRNNLNGMPNQNTLCARVKVGQLDWSAFDGSLDPNTITYLWIWNSDYNNVGSDREAGSPLQMPWTTVWCNPPVPSDTTITQGNCSGCESENTVTFAGNCQSIDVSSCKDLSNVVLVFDDCVHQKFDGLSSKTGTFAGTGSNAGKNISHAYIKSGCYQSGEGPGYGLRFDGPCFDSNCAPAASTGGSNGGGGNGNGGNGNGNGNGGNGNGNGGGKGKNK